MAKTGNITVRNRIMAMLVAMVACGIGLTLWLSRPEERAGRAGMTVFDVQLRDSVEREIGVIDSIYSRLAMCEKPMAYYMRTHSVVDEGFEHVARYDKMMRERQDSLLALKEALQRFLSGNASLIDIFQLPYPVFTMPFPIHLGNSLPTAFGQSAASMDGYEGGVDSLGRAHGQGVIETSDGDYYDGDWNHGQRHGFGFGIKPGERPHVGEWKDGRYLGERIMYTADRIYGIDISRYQHEKGRRRFSIDWKRLAITSLGTKSRKNIAGEVDYPISFIYIKSTEGTNIRNRYFASDYAQARKHGYRVGAYHFFSTKSGGAQQARFFCRASRYSHGDLPPVLDVEPSARQIARMGGVGAMFRQIRAWLNYVEGAWKVRPVLYVSQTFVNRYLPSAPDLMKNYDVWIARYGEYKPDVNLVYWQLCPDGRVRGIHTEVDINVFNGYKADFDALR